MRTEDKQQALNTRNLNLTLLDKLEGFRQEMRRIYLVADSMKDEDSKAKTRIIMVNINGLIDGLQAGFNKYMDS